MVEMPKYAKLCIIFLLLLILVFVSWKVTEVVSNNGFDISEISDGVTNSSEPSVIESENSEGTDIPEAVKEQHSLNKGNIPDEEYAVLNALTILMNSPMASEIGNANYEVKLVEGKWVTRFDCNEYSLFVTCDTIYFSPYMYTCTRRYTDEEMEFFYSIGKAWEIENEDGTYTVYYN